MPNSDRVGVVVLFWPANHCLIAASMVGQKLHAVAIACGVGELEKLRSCDDGGVCCGMSGEECVSKACLGKRSVGMLLDLLGSAQRYLLLVQRVR